MNNEYGNYPSVAGVHPDSRLARELYRSRAGELGAISDYTYYSIMFDPVMPGLAELFERISMTEMKHFHLLGELILALGEDPSIAVRLKNEPVDLIGDAPCKAPKASKRVLTSLLADEEAASREYARIATLAADNQPAAAILTRLSADEAYHAKALRQALNR